MRTGNQGDRMGLGDTVVMTEPSEPIDNEKGDGQHVWDDEEESVQYNYRYYLSNDERRLLSNDF